MIHILYLSLGSNLGDRLANLRTAISSLPPKIQHHAQSSIYETDPWGYTDQPAFLNLVIKAGTIIDPFSTLAYLKAIEVSMGRQETFRFGPRLIDLDILFYDDITLDSPNHPPSSPHRTCFCAFSAGRNCTRPDSSYSWKDDSTAKVYG